MKQYLEKLLSDSINNLISDSGLLIPKNYIIQLERTRDHSHGDFSSNIAMVLSKPTGFKPCDLAAEIITQIPGSEFIDKIDIAGPGFINFHLNQKAYSQIVPDIIDAGETFGQCTIGSGEKILIEFVSANPTGPLHIGHGRGAAYGAALSNLLDTVGFKVTREYYVNDAGRQMDILTISIWLRYLNRCGCNIPFPKKAYQADYVQRIAEEIYKNHTDEYKVSIENLITDVWDQDDEIQLDNIINFAKQALGEEKYNTIFSVGLANNLDDIRNDLLDFGIQFDNWFSEKSLEIDKLVDRCIEKLRDSGDIYEKAGALWFRSSQYGDEKDRVVVRENGLKTYFASDIAYHKNKFERGYSRLIDIWGADHHGYIDRIKAALSALQEDADSFETRLVQFATLYRGKEKLQMSTRSGQYVTLQELRSEVGNDAARFFYVMRKSEQHLDFDLELAKSHTNENPVYYIQYAHARICSVIKQMREKKYEYNQELALQHLDLLVETHEQSLLKNLSRYPETIVKAAKSYEPHLIGVYLRDLANDYHSYYNTHKFLIDDTLLRQARISLIIAIRQVISNGLGILGVSAPERM